MNILRQILRDKAREIALRKEAVPLRAMEQQAQRAPAPPDFRRALRQVPIALIAEVKRRSPSAGLIRTPFHPARIAAAYHAGGANAVSVLLDGPYFGGGEADFSAVRAAVPLPMLYKEFVIDEWQVHHARAIGASAVLLIVAALPADRLAALHRSVESAGLVALVEVHDRKELSVALDIGARVVGVNNRNLRTFVTRLETTYRLAALLPRDALLVSESGISSPEDVLQLKSAGAKAVLVGEHLLRQRNLTRAVKNLMGRAWAAS